MICLQQELSNKLNKVIIGNKFIWFSYETPIAFSHPETGLVVLNYTKSNTTYKHLKFIDGGNKTNRKNEEEFILLLNTYFK